MQKLIVFFLLLNSINLCAQLEVRTESSAMPLDDIVSRRILKERRPLADAPINEEDIFWEKRIWRILDVREKMNHSFSYPKRPFFSIIEEAARVQDVLLYSAENESFKEVLTKQEIHEILFQIDTVEVVDPVTLEVRLEIVENQINHEDVKRYRIKEVWYFDSLRGQLRVKILGVAPMVEVFDGNGNFRFERPLFWVYFPELRNILAHEPVFLDGNENQPISWDDLFTMRFFASTVYKTSNLQDARIKDRYAGVDAMLEADKIKQELFNFEHDLWSY